MSVPSREDLEAFAHTSSALLGLTIDPAYLPSVVSNLEVIFRHHGLISNLHLPPEIEPAFVFQP